MARPWGRPMRSRPLRTLLLAALLAVIFAAPSAANPAWFALQNAPVTTARFDDVCFVDEHIGWTGERSHLYRTLDGGDTWRTIEAPWGHPRCIAFATAARGWVGSVVDSFAL